MYIFFSIQTLETQSVQAEKCCSVPKKPEDYFKYILRLVCLQLVKVKYI